VAKQRTPEDLAQRTFVITMAGIAAWILAAWFFAIR